MNDRADMLAALRLQCEWGADEALLDTPQDRRLPAPARTAASDNPAPQPLPPPRAQQRRPAAAELAGPADAARLAANCDNLTSLQAIMAAFTGCALAATATKLVFADGAADARIMIIGEAPGAEEDRAGKPFVGPAGKLLNQMLASIGLDRATTRIANIVPWRPPGNRNPTDSEIAVCLPFLQRQVALVAPHCLLLLGAVATKAMLPAPERNAGIRRLRGIWRDVAIADLAAAIPTLPTYHPAYLLRTPQAKREAWLDFLSLRQWLEEH